VRSLRGPLILLGLGVLLLLASTLLDRGGERSRDLALLLGAPALYLVLPLAVLWLIVVLVLRGRSGSGRGKPR
jgi:hypothetical protein